MDAYSQFGKRFRCSGTIRAHLLPIATQNFTRKKSLSKFYSTCFEYSTLIFANIADTFLADMYHWLATGQDVNVIFTALVNKLRLSARS